MSRLIRKDHLREVILALWASPRGDRHEDYYTALTLVAAAFGLNVDAAPEQPRRRWVIDAIIRDCDVEPEQPARKWVIIGGEETEDI